MKALVYRGPGEKALEDRPTPTIVAPGDAIVRIVKTTICGTDPHILKGDMATCATFEICQDVVAPGGVIANVGVHGSKVDLHLENLWARNITITTRLVDTVTTPMLLKTVQSNRIDPARLVSHHFTLGQILDAYATLGRAADTHALKVIISA